jgi:hypothetical protein
MVRTETPWSLTVHTSGPLTNQRTGDVIPLQRFQSRLSGTSRWVPFREGSSLALRAQPPAPNGRVVTFDYSVIIIPTDAPGQYDTSVEYTISAAP